MEISVKAWVLHQGCQLGRIVQDSGNGKVTLQFDNGSEHQFAKELIVPEAEGYCAQNQINQQAGGAEDLIGLPYLNNAIIFNTLHARYEQDVIYTNIGPMLISVNPFHSMHALYSQGTMDSYRKQLRSQSQGDEDSAALPPHIYQVVNNALHSLKSKRKSQSILITGESGSGKTEATKLALTFLTAVARSVGTEADSADPGSVPSMASMMSMGRLARIRAGEIADYEALYDSILASNPILEAFGNAKTERNDNSSRFGKLIRIQLDEQGHILGAKIQQYLLESIRVVRQGANERNFHIFYQIFKGLSTFEKELLHINYPLSHFRYLNYRDAVIEGVDDGERYETLRNSLQKMKFTNEEVNHLLKLLAAILHFGNIEFVENGDKVTIAANCQETVNNICELLEIDGGALQHALLYKVMRGGARQTSYNMPYTIGQALENVDSMAKSIYAKLFDHIVSRINQSLRSPTAQSPHGAPPTYLSILDIYGFEIFPNNSMEQFCINYANEKLHQQFINIMFKAEQEEYKKENVLLESQVSFEDNQECIDLIESSPCGILSVINEETKLPKASEKNIMDKLSDFHKSNSYFKFSLRQPNQFQVNHYAESVTYTIDGFLDKNRNNRNIALDQLMITSRLRICQQLFGSEDQPSGQQGQQQRQSTVLQLFKKELSDLFDLLNATELHFIRCLKPNDAKQSGLFDGAKIVHQLKCNGILETVQLRRQGFEHNFAFSAFARQYPFLGLPTQDDGITREQLVLFANGSRYKIVIGKTKVFLHSGVFRQLEGVLQAKRLRSVILFQSRVRSLIQYSNYLMLLRERKEREERKRREEEERRRLEEERKRREEQERKQREEEARRREEELRQQEEERRRQEEARRRRAAEEEANRTRLEEEKRRAREEASRDAKRSAKAEVDFLERQKKENSLLDEHLSTLGRYPMDNNNGQPQSVGAQSFDISILSIAEEDKVRKVREQEEENRLLEERLRALEDEELADDPTEANANATSADFGDEGFSMESLTADIAGTFAQRRAERDRKMKEEKMKEKQQSQFSFGGNFGFDSENDSSNSISAQLAIMDQETSGAASLQRPSFMARKLLGENIMSAFSFMGGSNDEEPEQEADPTEGFEDTFSFSQPQTGTRARVAARKPLNLDWQSINEDGNYFDDANGEALHYQPADAQTDFSFLDLGDPHASYQPLDPDFQPVTLPEGFPSSPFSERLERFSQIPDFTFSLGDFPTQVDEAMTLQEPQFQALERFSQIPLTRFSMFAFDASSLESSEEPAPVAISVAEEAAKANEAKLRSDVDKVKRLIRQSRMVNVEEKEILSSAYASLGDFDVSEDEPKQDPTENSPAMNPGTIARENVLRENTQRMRAILSQYEGEIEDENALLAEQERLLEEIERTESAIMSEFTQQAERRKQSKDETIEYSPTLISATQKVNAALSKVEENSAKIFSLQNRKKQVRRTALEANQFLSQQRRGNFPNQQGQPRGPNPNQPQMQPHNPNVQRPPQGQARGQPVNANPNPNAPSYAMGRGRGAPFASQPMGPGQGAFSPPTSPRPYTDANPKMRQGPNPNQQASGTVSGRMQPTGRGQPLSPRGNQSPANPFPGQPTPPQPSQPSQPQFKQVQQQQQYRKTSPNVSSGRSEPVKLTNMPPLHDPADYAAVQPSERPGSGPKPTLQKSQRYAQLPSVSALDGSESTQQPIVQTLNFTQQQGAGKFSQNPQGAGGGHHSSPNPHHHVNSSKPQNAQQAQLFSTSPRGNQNPIVNANQQNQQHYNTNLSPRSTNVNSSGQFHTNNLSPRAQGQPQLTNNPNVSGTNNTSMVSPRTMQGTNNPPQQQGARNPQTGGVQFQPQPFNQPQTNGPHGLQGGAKPLAKSTPNLGTKVQSQQQQISPTQGVPQPQGPNQASFKPPNQPMNNQQANQFQGFNAVPFNANTRNHSIMQTTDKLSNSAPSPSHQQVNQQLHNLQQPPQQQFNNPNQQQFRPNNSPPGNQSPQGHSGPVSASSPLNKSTGSLGTVGRGRGIVMKQGQQQGLVQQQPNPNPNQMPQSPNPNLVNVNQQNLNNAQRSVSPNRAPNANPNLNTGTVGRGKGINMMQQQQQQQQQQQGQGQPRPNNPNMMQQQQPQKPGGMNPQGNPMMVNKQGAGGPNQNFQQPGFQRPPMQPGLQQGAGKPPMMQGNQNPSLQQQQVQNQKVLAQQFQQQQYNMQGLDGLNDPFEESDLFGEIGGMSMKRFSNLLSDDNELIAMGLSDTPFTESLDEELERLAQLSPRNFG